jgi:hypothetical protein
MPSARCTILIKSFLLLRERLHVLSIWLLLVPENQRLTGIQCAGTQTCIYWGKWFREIEITWTHQRVDIQQAYPGDHDVGDKNPRNVGKMEQGSTGAQFVHLRAGQLNEAIIHITLLSPIC